jgi:hypothetical protein
MFEKVLIDTDVNHHDGDYELDESDEEDDPSGDHEMLSLKLKVEIDFGREKFRSVIAKHKQFVPYKPYKRDFYDDDEERYRSYSSVVSALLFSGKET